MKLNYRIVLLVLLFSVALGAPPAFGQQADLTPDDRYSGYRGIRIVWPTAQPNLPACKAGEYYEPTATNLVRFAAPEDGVRVQRYDECVWMITITGWRWVLRPARTKVAVDGQGRDLYDLGFGLGKVCKNPRPKSVPYLPPVLVPTPTPRPIPPPTAHLRIRKEFRLLSGEWSRDIPAFTFSVRSNNGYYNAAQNNSRGQVDLEVPSGCYSVNEVPGQTFRLLGTVPSSGILCVEAGEDKTMLIKNEQVVPEPPPPPPPPAHVCAVCEGFESMDIYGYKVYLNNVNPLGVQFGVRVRFNRPVHGHKWSMDGRSKFGVNDVLVVNPSELEPGETYRVTVTVVDDQDHVITCNFVMMVDDMPLGYCEKDHNIFIDATWVQIRCHPVRTAIIVCAATAAVSYGTNTFIPPCGWWGRHQGIKPGVQTISPAHSPPSREWLDFAKIR